MRNLLITGSSGYLGSSFINQFQDKYDFFKFSLLKDSIENINFENIDRVLHCAALVHQKEECQYSEYYDINVKYPIDLAKKAKESGVKQFVFISTIAVYGDNNILLKEDTDCNPVTLYGKSKLEAEQELKKLEDDNFTISIVRPPMVYGKDAPGNIASLINIIKKVPLLPFARIKNRRSFVYIGNLCHLIDIIYEKKRSGIFLASDDKSISTTKLIELIAKNLDKKVYLIKIPFFQELLKLMKPSLYKRLYESLEVDNSLTKEVLEFENLYSVEEGIKLMIKGSTE